MVGPGLEERSVVSEQPLMVSRKNVEARFWICPTGIGTSWGEEFAEVGVKKGLDVVTPTGAKTCLLTSGFLHKRSLTASCLKIGALSSKFLTDSRITFEELRWWYLSSGDVSLGQRQVALRPHEYKDGIIFLQTLSFPEAGSRGLGVFLKPCKYFDKNRLLDGLCKSNLFFISCTGSVALTSVGLH